MQSAIVFNIERFATKDGPGIRTLIFLKGCNLKCEWCQNPESQKHSPEIIYYKNLCRGCGRCLKVCEYGAISTLNPLGLVTDSEKCELCRKCVDNCFYGAREVIGKMMSTEELFEEILKDNPYYEESGGGITLSGGEPMLQVSFIKEFLSICKKNNINTAIETAGNVPWISFEEIYELVDLFMYDIKHMDPIKHKKGTGVENDLILENIEKLSAIHNNIVIRVPVIPHFNMNQTELSDILNFAKGLDNISKVELLPYHRLGKSKYEGLGREYNLKGIAPVDPSELAEFEEMGKALDLKVIVGSE